MKSFCLMVFLAPYFIFFTSCRTPVTPKAPLEILRDQAVTIARAGGVAAIGEGRSTSVSFALDKAKNRAVTELASTLGNKVQSMHNQFLQEQAQGASCLTLFQNAATILTEQEMLGGIPVDVIHETRDGITTAWILVAVDPKVIFDAFACQAGAQPESYTMFKDSGTFKKLTEALATYGQLKMSGAASGPANRTGL